MGVTRRIQDRYCTWEHSIVPCVSGVSCLHPCEVVYFLNGACLSSPGCKVFLNHPISHVAASPTPKPHLCHLFPLQQHNKVPNVAQPAISTHSPIYLLFKATEGFYPFHVSRSYPLGFIRAAVMASLSANPPLALCCPDSLIPCYFFLVSWVSPILGAASPPPTT